MRCAECTRLTSYINVHGGWNDVQRFALKRKDFAVDQNINRNRNVEFHLLDRLARRQWMFDVRAIVEFWQQPQQTEAADRPPANEFNQAVGGIGIGSNQHGAAGEFAVIEGEEQAAAAVPIFVVIAAQDECAALELNDADENPEEI